MRTVPGCTQEGNRTIVHLQPGGGGGWTIVRAGAGRKKNRNQFTPIPIIPEQFPD